VLHTEKEFNVTLTYGSKVKVLLFCLTCFSGSLHQKAFYLHDVWYIHALGQGRVPGTELRSL